MRRLPFSATAEQFGNSTGTGNRQYLLSPSGHVRRPDVVDHHGRFAWYELMTTDVAAARTFYATVVGWDARDASTADLGYTLFTSARTAVSGLMNLPNEATKKGATPRWMGYIAVNDVDATTSQWKRLGGAVYVPPTDTNIGRISVVADPQTATLALVDGLKLGEAQPAERDQPARVGWHELLAADPNKAFAFYGKLFGWQKADAETGSMETYQLFAAGGHTIGGIFGKREREPFPFWLYYFNVDDIDVATQRVKSQGGRIFEGPLEVPGGAWVARCIDPQGAMFALQGRRSRRDSMHNQGLEVGWSTNWGGISSHGKLVKSARSKPGAPDSKK